MAEFLRSLFSNLIKQIAGIPSLQEDTSEPGAESILQRVQKSYSVIHEFRWVSLKNYPKLDFKFYQDTQTWFENQGFIWLGDCEDLTEKENNPSMSACIRVLRSPDGNIVVSIYDVHYGGFMKLLQMIGFIPREMRTVDIETEFANGTFLCTSTSKLAGKIKTPPSIARVFFPGDTPLENLLEAHQNLILSWGQEEGYQPVSLFDKEEILLSQQRMQQLKNEFRKQVGWITDDEIRNIAGSSLMGAGAAVTQAMQKFKPVSKNADRRKSE